MKILSTKATMKKDIFMVTGFKPLKMETNTKGCLKMGKEMEKGHTSIKENTNPQE